MKRFCLLFVPLLLFAVQARAYDFEADDVNGNRLFYSISKTTVTVVSELGGNTTYSGDIVIPETVQANDGTEYTVTAIDASAFINGASLTSVTIPSTITSIGNYAFQSCTSLATVNFNATECSNFSFNAYHPFYGCSSLTTVNIGASVTKIPAYFLQGISSLKTLTIAEGSALTSIGTYAFDNCSSLESSITVPDGVTSIENNTFYGCSSLPSITLPDNLTSIGTYAFYNCSDLTKISIPVGVTSIGTYAFSGCTSLETVTFEEESALTSIGNYAFNSCSSLTDIAIPAACETIGTYAFQTCTSLATVTFGDGSALTSIGTYAFYNCTSLTTINIPDGITSIEACTFYGCSSLSSVTLPESLTSIGMYAFQNCTSLTSITLPDNLTTIGPDAFYNCTSLTSINIPDGVTSIAVYTFYGCSSLSSVTMPDSLTSIGQDAFYNCTSLTTINIPDGVTSIDTYAFYGCSSLSSVTLSENLTTIGNYAFYNCSALTEITIPEALTSIGNESFYQCTELATVNFNAAECADFTYNSYTKNNPFSGCSALETVNIGAKVTRIPNYLFINAPVTSVTFADNSELTTIATDAFYNCSALTEIAIPAACETIGDYAFGYCSKLTTVTFGAESALTSIGNVAFENCSALTEIAIPAKCETIGGNAFQSCTSLATVTFAEESALTSIGNNAFYSCSALTEIAIPAKCETIGNSAFSFCQYIASITFGENSALTSIGPSAFYCCSALMSINLPAGVTTIDTYAFEYCSALTEITIPEKVTSIGNGAFYNCTSLTTLNFNAAECADFSSTNKYQPFYTCSKLATVNIGASVKQLPAYFLYGITSLGEVAIPEGSVLETIGVSAFYNCSALTSLCTIPATCETIGEDALYNVPISALCFADGAIYSTDEDKYALYNGDKTELIVYYAKNTLEEYTIPASVVTIDDTAFEGNTSLQTLLFEDGSVLASIGANAFDGCTKLATIAIPATCETISDYAFNGCKNLETVTFEEESKLDSIGAYAFNGCTSLTAIAIPATCETIGDDAFYGCSKLATVTIPDDSQLESIGEYAFGGCLALTEIYIPAGVTSIGAYAFYNCTSLETVTFAENSALTAIAAATFYVCSALKEITIPAGVTTIGNSAFGLCSSLVSVNMPDSLTTIDTSAFYNCTSLKEITIPEGVTSIGYYAFRGCTSLETVHFNAATCTYTFYSSTKKTDYLTFQNCTALTKVTIGAKVTSIPENFLYGSTSLERVEIEENSVLTTINTKAFYNCSAIIYMCTIPATCETIVTDALYNVPLTGFCFEDGGYYSTDGRALYNGDATELIYYYTPDTHEDYEILSSATSIDSQAFSGCTYLTTVTFGEETQIESIDADAFYQCTSLESITIPESVTSIGNYAFEYCSSLKEFIIPAGVTSIGQYAFGYCSELTEITIPENVTSVGLGAFRNCTSLATVHFNATKCGAFSYGSTTSGTSSAYYRQQFYNCTALTTVTIGANVTVIPENFLRGAGFTPPVTKVVVTNNSTEDGTEKATQTSIGDYAFYNCEFLAEIAMPDSLTTIGTDAFRNCAALMEITIPEKVTSIGNWAFNGCTSLAALHFNAAACKSVSSGSSYPFYNCSALKTATIGANVTTIPQYLFYDNSVLETVTFDEGSVLETIGSDSFYNCSELQALDLPSSVITIEKEALNSCSKIKEVTIPSGVTTIGNMAFYNCSALATLNFNAVNCTTMGTVAESAIYGCSNLSTVNIADSVKSIPSNFLIGTRNDKFPKLTSITIPDGVTTIGSYALYDVDLLDSLTIGNGVKNIGKNAFTYCTQLNTIICNATDPPSCDNQAFYRIADDSWLVVPEGYSQIYTSEGTVQALQASQGGWSDIAHMREATVSFPIRNTEGYATHYSPYEYTLADNLEATTIVDADSDGGLTMYWEFGHGTYTDEDGYEQDQSPIVPAGVAVLIREVEPNNKENQSNIDNDGEQSYAEYSNTTVNWEDEDAPENMLYGSKVETKTTVGEDGDDDDYYFYKFAYWYKAITDSEGNSSYSDNGVLGFYWGNSETGGPFEISANHAWLAIPKSIVDDEYGTTEAKLNGYPLVDGDGNDLYGTNGQTTRIDDVDGDDAADSGSDIIYNMAGQRVNDMNRRGVYIVNGRKVAVK